MNSVTFSRKSAALCNTIKDLKEREAFRKACIEATKSNPDHPLSALLAKFQAYFEQGV